MWQNSFSCVMHDPFICDVTRSPIYICVVGEWVIINRTRSTYDMTHSHVRHDSLTWKTWLLIHMRQMWRNSFSHVTWLILTCDMTHWHETHDASFVCDKTHVRIRHMTHQPATRVSVNTSEVWLIHMCDMTDCPIARAIINRVRDTQHVWHDSFTRYACNCKHMRNMTHSYVSQDSFICVTWLIHMHDMTHSCVWHDSSIYCACHYQRDA